VNEPRAGTQRFGATGIVKRFGPVVALDDVSFACERGEIHALLGENGAGKSTLIKILAGAQQPDGGTLTFDGVPARLHGPQDAVARSVAVVHQDYHVWPDLTVTENVIGTLAHPPQRGIFARSGTMRATARALLERLGIPLDVDRKVRELDAAEIKFVEIARALAVDAAFLILDEPTASLESRESDRVLALLERLRDTGHGIILVTHRLEEVVRVADRATILRDGRNAGNVTRDTMTGDVLVEAILGRRPEAPQVLRACSDVAALQFRGVRTRPAGEPFDLDLRRGEILGLTGVVGSGAVAPVRALAGLLSMGGTLALDGAPLIIRSPADAVRAGIGYIPEDRKRLGLALEQSVANNIALASLHRINRYGFTDTKARTAIADGYRASLSIRCASVDAPVGSLSGGNQQKVLIARWLASGARIIAIEEPTHGVDIGAKAEIHRELAAFADAGGSVIFMSTELRELLAIAHRIVIFHAGAPVAILPHHEASEARITAIATGVATEAA
jgi:ABC-type sugar transport system ATPase subunit